MLTSPLHIFIVKSVFVGADAYIRPFNSHKKRFLKTKFSTLHRNSESTVFCIFKQFAVFFPAYPFTAHTFEVVGVELAVYHDKSFFFKRFRQKDKSNF